MEIRRRGSIITIVVLPGESATTASSGSKKEKYTIVGRRPKPLTEDLSEDLRDAWDRLRETAVSFSDQRICASHKSIMFSRKSCYFFVRPKRSLLEISVLLGRTLKAPQVRRVDRGSRSKLVHAIHIRHRDEVEAPITDWLQKRTNYPICWSQRATRLVPNRSRSRSPARFDFDQSLPTVAATFGWPCTESATQDDNLSDVIAVVDKGLPQNGQQ